MNEYLKIAFLWFLIPFGNFFFWKYIGNNSVEDIPVLACPVPVHSTLTTEIISSGPLKMNYSHCSTYNIKKTNKIIEQKYISEDFTFNFLRTTSDHFEQFKNEELAEIKSSSPVIVIPNEPNQPEKIRDKNGNHLKNHCGRYVDVVASTKPGVRTCIAVIRAENQETTDYLLRYNSDPKKTGRILNQTRPKTSGIFRNVAKKKGRISLQDKFLPLLQHLNEIETIWVKLLEARGIFPGDDIVVMVVNDGEIDLFLNFACSCRANGISLHNMFVISASAEIVAMVRATGAVGFFHPFFAKADRRASSGYLDRVFVEMMWYKAFSLWLGLKLGYNVLFQDVDLVWFKNPLEYFHRHRNKSLSSTNPIEFTAYFSDDGQRSIRYTPFYANSGFYYLLSTPKNIYFSYSIVIAFDILQATGSHQNVFTARLMELMDMVRSHSLFLNLFDFPSGVKFHHDKNYMNKIVAKQFVPYIFHMCWTANKKQKLENFNSVNMWYVQESCPLESLVPPGGSIYSRVISKIGTGSGRNYLEKLTEFDTYKQFDYLSRRCCTVP